MEACMRRAMPETQAVEEALETAVDGQADDADEAVITSGSAPGSGCYSDVSDLEEYDPPNG